MKRFLFFALLLIAGLSYGQTDTIVKWTFPNNPDDSVADGGIIQNIGAFIKGIGCGTVGFANSGYSTNAARATGWNSGANTKYWQVMFSTFDHDSLYITSKQRSSNTGPKHFKIRYKIGIAGTWTDLQNAAVTDTSTWTQMFTDTLPAACNNQDSVFLSWIMTDDSAVNNTIVVIGGSSSIDDIKIWGKSISGITPPFVTNAFIQNTSNIAVVFSEPVNNTAQNTSNYIFSGGSVNTIGMSATSDTAFLTLTSPIINGDAYTLTVQNVQDTDATPMASPQTFNFLFNNSVLPVVITEIMYNPPESNVDSLEFVEFYNNSASDAHVGGYSFKVGAFGTPVIYYDFPAGTIIPANDYAVIARNPSIVDNFFGISGTLQWATGQSLSNNGTKLHLVNTVGDYIDSVHYMPSSPWPTTANGQGASLSLCDPSLDNSLAASWSASTEFVDSLNLKAVTANPDTGCTIVGISDYNEASVELNYYPNPVSNELSVEFNGIASDISIYDVVGNNVFTAKKVVSKTLINTSSFTKGIYLLKVTIDNNIITRKITVM